MDTINEWKDLTITSLKTMGSDIASTLPNIIGALFILLIGWLITKVIVFLLKKILRLAKVDKLTDKINESNLFGDADIKFKVSNVIVGFVKWIIFLVFLIVAADIMNWEIISTEIGNLLRYLPRLFSAIALFMIGLYIANFIKKAVAGIFESFEFSGAKIISALVFYVIVIFITITALNQAGVDTTIITNNVTIILGAFLLAIALGMGLGSKDIINDLLSTYYTRRNYMVGDKVKLKGMEGTIEAIDNVCMTLKTKEGKTIIPIREVINSRVDIDS
ncbi:mechanosensitive ion channel family protein [Muriicola sp. Z0-33]|uniref:mechanosensitive ion channel family protein n=1 Tax=Muriicola sp. Z0-33 TaxID=2816957 RepID=UPI0022379314|nr:mechanosensitive ion channel domain-containing protein [Muriicola sp. Z0-33]MCW5517699.1 mechanosensitive ion channel [Muriicola sp. Z0-33]